MCGGSGNWCLAYCTFEVSRFRCKLLVQRYLLVLCLPSAVETAIVLGGVVTGVLRKSRKLVFNLMYH